MAKRRVVIDDALYPDDILGVPAATKRHVVHTVGPALVLVIEREAPLRFDFVSSSEQEVDALREWIRESPSARLVLCAFREATVCDEGDWLSTPRADAHAERVRGEAR